MAAEEPPPEWLPPGWTVVVSTRLSGSSAGRRDKYYTNLVDGRKFRSKNEVLRYVEGSSPENATHNPLKKAVPTLNLGLQKESDEWLPEGWITESKTRPDGRQDKYYTNPENGQRYRSKNEVLRYIRALSPEIAIQIPMEKALSAPNANRNESNECLPEGWITEIKTRTDGRQDKYYIDPSTGYKFKSMAQVWDHVSSKEGSDRCYKKQALNKPASTDSDYLRPSRACRSLFEGQMSSNNSSGLAHEPPSNDDNGPPPSDVSQRAKKIESNTNQSSDQNIPTDVENKLSQERSAARVELNGLRKGESNEEWKRTKQLANRTRKPKIDDPSSTGGKVKKEIEVPLRRSVRVPGKQP